MPNKRPNFQRIIPTNDPPKIVDPAQPEPPKPIVEEPYFQQRTVRFDLPKTPCEERTHRETNEKETKPYYEPFHLFVDPKKNPEDEPFHLLPDIKKDAEDVECLPNKDDPGLASLRKNYLRVKPGSKYSQEGLRPGSPNTPYSYLSKEVVKNNPQQPETFFEPTAVYSNSIPKRDRHYKERPTDCFSEHLVRGISAPQPYCFIAKEAKNNYVPPEYTNSRYGSFPTWGVEETGFRTRSHYISEPANRFGNIDMYKRPLTNQPGSIIFDHGRPNNGYYLQRHQYDNTWFNSNIKLNQQDILKSIAPKTKAEYDFLEESHKGLIRAKSMIWPPHSEYTHSITLKNNS